MINAIDKENLPVLVDVLIAIKNNPLVNDGFCVWVYTDIMNLADGISEIKKASALESLIALRDKLADMHAREAREKEEEDVESLLDNI